MRNENKIQIFIPFNMSTEVVAILSTSEAGTVYPSRAPGSIQVFCGLLLLYPEFLNSVL